MSPPPSGGVQLGFLPSFACSAVAACVAEATTLPLDTAKVRLQMQGGLLKPGELPKYRRARTCEADAAATFIHSLLSAASPSAEACWAL